MPQSFRMPRARWLALVAGLCLLMLMLLWVRDQHLQAQLYARGSDVPYEVLRYAGRHAEAHDGKYPRELKGLPVSPLAPDSNWLRPAGAQGGPTPAGTSLAPVGWGHAPPDYPLPAYVYDVTPDGRSYVLYYLDQRQGQAFVVMVLTPRQEQKARAPGAPPRIIGSLEP